MCESDNIRDHTQCWVEGRFVDVLVKLILGKANKKSLALGLKVGRFLGRNRVFSLLFLEYNATLWSN